jgi:hypothetical protein
MKIRPVGNTKQAQTGEQWSSAAPLEDLLRMRIKNGPWELEGEPEVTGKDESDGERAWVQAYAEAKFRAVISINDLVRKHGFEAVDAAADSILEKMNAIANPPRPAPGEHRSWSSNEFYKLGIEIDPDQMLFTTDNPEAYFDIHAIDPESLVVDISAEGDAGGDYAYDFYDRLEFEEDPDAYYGVSNKDFL